MAQNSIDGDISIAGDGAVLLTNQPFPVCGTVTLDITLTGWTGDIYPRLIGRRAAAGTAGTACIYQDASSATDKAAASNLSSGKFYVRLDGTRLELYVENFAGSTCTGTWAWSQG